MPKIGLSHSLFILEEPRKGSDRARDLERVEGTEPQEIQYY